MRIVAGGGLDEYGVDRLVRSGTPIDVYAVGTRLGVADPTGRSRSGPSALAPCSHRDLHGVMAVLVHRRGEEARTMTTREPARHSDRPTSRNAPGGGEGTALTHARVGDEIVVRGTTSGVVTRDGEVVGVHHPDGSPPYDVRWADSGRVVTLYCPGLDPYVRHPGHGPVVAPAGSGAAEPYTDAAEVASAGSAAGAGGDRVRAR